MLLFGGSQMTQSWRISVPVTHMGDISIDKRQCSIALILNFTIFEVKGQKHSNRVRFSRSTH